MVQPRAERLADPSDLAALLGVRTNHPRVGPALAQASARFRGAVRHPVTRTRTRVVMDGSGVRDLLLPGVQVVGEVVVRLNPASGTGPPATLTRGRDFQVSSRFGILRRTAGPWPDQLDAVDVDFEHGWEVVPDDIAEAVLEQAAAVFRGRPGIQSLAVGSEATTWTPGVSEAWKTAVDRYHIGRRS